MLRTLYAQLEGYKKYILACVGLMSADVVAVTFMPTLMGRIVDVGVAAGDLGYIARTGLLMAALSLAAIAVGVANARLSSRASQGFAANLRRALFDKVQSFSFADIDRFSSSSLVTRLTNDVNQLQNTLLMSLRMFLRAPLMLVIATGFAVRINARLSLVLAAALPLLVAAIALLMRRVESLFAEVQARVDLLNRTVQENLVGIRAVKAYVREDFEKRKFKAASETLAAAGIRAGYLVSLAFPLLLAVMNGAMIATVWFGGRQVHAGEMGTGQLLSFISYITEILFSVMIFSFVFILLARAEASAKRVAEVLDSAVSIEDKPGLAAGPGAPRVAAGRVEFRGASFRYGAGGEGRDALSGIDLAIEPGEFVAIVGGTGSGKTSLASLVPRLYDVSAGQVLVDGVDVRDYRVEDLRAGIGVVLQRNLLFSGTIAENLRWGSASATQEELAEAARIAEADDFVRAFPAGYATELGQGGVNLSGGQKQRLCIARALLKRPRILILDDATSAVDTATEARIRARFARQLAGTTVIMIAQRLSSFREADRIVVLDDGKVAGVGTHGELFERNAIYRDICLSQQEGIGA